MPQSDIRHSDANLAQVPRSELGVARTSMARGDHTGSAGAPVFAVVTQGDVPEDAIAYARDKLGELHALADARVLFARLSLVQEADPARERPAVAKVSLDLDGDLVRAHVAARTMHEAADLLARRLRDKLEHRAERRDARRRRGPASAAGGWRHGDLPAERPEYVDRPPEDRRLVRRKTFATEEITPDEAVFDMEQLDFDFHLFRDLTDHTDAVIERRDDGYRLTLAGAPVAERPPTAASMELAALPAPTMSLRSALEDLELSAARFVFFVDEATGRGAVAYRRYDGHYGLIALE
jgi:hypothetical protein